MKDIMDKQKIIKSVIDTFKKRFRVFDNTGEGKKIVGGQFPDIILMRPEPPPNEDILVIMKIEDGKNLIDNVPEWRGLSSTMSVFYIVIPQEKLDEAKKLASATGVRARFAPFTVDNDKVSIRYE
jgi:hypothetical protein